jgi:hypothetical protein
LIDSAALQRLAKASAAAIDARRPLILLDPAAR